MSDSPLNDPAGTPPPAAPLSATEMRAQIALLAEQVSRLRGRVRSAEALSEGTTKSAELPAAEMIAIAERAAEQIRESARREAARVSGERMQGSSELASVLLGTVQRQRQTVGVLAAEAERIEQSALSLRRHLRALENDLDRMHDFLRSVMGEIAVTVAAALPDTSPHRRG